MRRAVSASDLRLGESRQHAALSLAAPVEADERFIVRPRVTRIRGEWLEWSMEEPGEDQTKLLSGHEKLFGETARVGDGLLWQFIKLWSAPDDRIASFARENGVLFLVSDGRVGGNPAVQAYEDELVLRRPIRGVPGKDGVYLGAPEWLPVRWHRESVQHWRDWSLVTYLVLRFGVELRQAAGRVDVERMIEQWRVSIPPQDPEPRYHHSEPIFLAACLQWKHPTEGRGLTSLDDQRLELSGMLDIFAQMAHASLRVRIGPSPKPEIRVSLPGPLSVTRPTNPIPDIARQLIQVLVGGERINTCPDCGEPYPCLRRRGRCQVCAARKRREDSLLSYHAKSPAINANRRAVYAGTRTQDKS